MNEPLFVLCWDWPDHSGFKVCNLLFTETQKQIMDHVFNEMPGEMILTWQEVQFPKGADQ